MKAFEEAGDGTEHELEKFKGLDNEKKSKRPRPPSPDSPDAKTEAKTEPSESSHLTLL